MMYYFPININGRRLHYFNLKEETPVPLFGFIVKDYDSPVLLSIDCDAPQLISTGGSQENVDLTNASFKVEKLQSIIENLPVYKVSIMTKKTNVVRQDGCMLISDGFMGADDPKHHANVSLDSSLCKDTSFVIVVSYTDKNGIEYQDAVKFYLHKEDYQLVSGALDFGSEASQIRFNDTDTNDRLIETMQGFGNYPAKEYWQGKPTDKLYKSVFFVNTRPGTTKYADSPKLGIGKSFVLPLLDASTSPSLYENLELLPNLKLVEIGHGLIDWTGREIMFPSGSNIEGGGYAGLASRELRDSVLRLILGNFLHCMIKKSCSREDKLLRMVILVPNVYYQSKIFMLVKNLYSDFDIIKKNGLYPHCKGFEVQVVSESDASFMGVKHFRLDIKNRENGYFLIIDAGKGTTDFSILKQLSDFSRFSSVYRDGIPASGNVITFAFYEALRNFLAKSDFDLDSMIRQSDKSVILTFTNLLEQFKKNYSTSPAEKLDLPEKKNINNLNDLNTFLERQMKKKSQIPECKTFIDSKIKTLTDCLMKSLENYMSQSKAKFVHIMLSGRGFLFEPFKQSVMKEIIARRWVEGESDFIRIDGDSAKTICMDGALAVEKECSVNCNSGLIGSPIIRTAAGKEGFWRDFFPFRRRMRELDMNFFYEGSQVISSQNVEVKIGGRVYLITSSEREDKSIYYVGDSFLCQKENSSEKIEERTFAFSDSQTEGLVLEAMFPYNIIPLNSASESDAVAVDTEEDVEEIAPVIQGSTFSSNDDDLDRM